MDVASIFRLFLDVGGLYVQIFELEGQFVDGNHMLSGKVLKGPCQKGLWEKETYIIDELPEIQKHFGVPLSIQSCRKLIRLFKSSVHDARGFIERKPFWSHSLGTWLSNNELAMSSNSSLMTIKPFRAFFTLTRFSFITSKSLLYLMTS